MSPIHERLNKCPRDQERQPSVSALSKGRPVAGGRALRTPFETIYSTNITPDPETGIGQWSNKEFYTAMHEGIGRGGKHLYPAFPYLWYTKVNANDVRAIKAYLDMAPESVYSRCLPWSRRRYQSRST